MKIAVIGSGISGLSAAWLLSKRNEVHLFESDSRLGGHAHTVDVTEGAGRIPIDTGFLVYNQLTYPNLCGFFEALGVKTTESDMSLSIQSRAADLEWSGTNLNTVFAQRSNLLRPGFYSMLREIQRFAREAYENLDMSQRLNLTLRELLDTRRYSPAFRHHYLIPAGAAIWSTPENRMFDFPAATFLTFFMNHKLLEMNGRPIWRTVVNGSREYVKLAAAKVAHVHLSTAVERVERRDGAVFVTSPRGTGSFDRVVMATHAPITRRLLLGQSPAEREILAAFTTLPNRAVLHTDASVMPKRKLCWASWNVRGTHGLPGSDEAAKASLTYYINRLQPVRTTQNYFVSLNVDDPLKNELAEFSYAHPQFDRAAIEAQQKLLSIQGHGGVYFAGAWSRYGFHEDGILSGVKVAERLNVEIPWMTK